MAAQDVAVEGFAEAFAVLEVLAHADDGLGLTAVIACQRPSEDSDHRYDVGLLIARVARRWQPDRALRQAAQARRLVSIPVVTGVPAVIGGMPEDKSSS